MLSDSSRLSNKNLFIENPISTSVPRELGKCTITAVALTAITGLVILSLAIASSLPAYCYGIGAALIVVALIPIAVKKITNSPQEARVSPTPANPDEHPSPPLETEASNVDHNVADTSVHRAVFDKHLDTLRAIISNKAESAVNCGKRIIWIPYQNIEKNSVSFPNELHARDIYYRRLYYHYPDDLVWKAREVTNTFLSWLYGEIESVSGTLKQKGVIAMNCSDFVNWTLFRAGVTTKDQVMKRYENYRQRELAEETNNDLVFQGYPFREVEREAVATQTQLGDIILINDTENEDVHVVLRADGEEEVYSLWYNQGEAPGARKISLTDLQGAKNLRYRICSLRDFIETQAREA